jgi:hypothetical protein
MRALSFSSLHIGLKLSMNTSIASSVTKFVHNVRSVVKFLSFTAILTSEIDSTTQSENKRNQSHSDITLHPTRMET